MRQGLTGFLKLLRGTKIAQPAPSTILDSVLIKGKVSLCLDITNWKFGRLDIYFLGAYDRPALHSSFMEGSAEKRKF